MPWALLFGLLGNIPGLFGEYFKKKQEIEQVKLDAQLKLQIANTELAGKVAEAQFELNKTIVASTGSWFKYLTFAVWFGPFVIGIVSPIYGKAIFTNLADMPEWYVSSVVTIMFTIWGIQVSAPVVGGIFTGISAFFQDRRAYQLQKINALGEANSLNLEQAKKEIFDTLRKATGALSQSQVDVISPVLDKVIAIKNNTSVSS